ncbi:MAG: hypothetical protein FWD09_04875 [Lentimicrobiaceae bacterium]|nr:hypothetical protein [Lentimicrobiaceae bacterium]
MEKPTGVIQKIIESLQQINALDVYSPIEKDIILHNLRAAYMIFLNIPVNAESEENKVERLFVEEKVADGDWSPDDGRGENEETETEQQVEIFEEEIAEEIIIEEETVEFVDIIEEEIVEEEVTEEKMVEEEIIEEEIIEEKIAEEQTVEEEIIEEEIIEEEIIEEKIIIEPSNVPVVPSASQKQPLHDDLLEFIPDARPQTTLLFEETTLFRSEKKSLNDLLTEKKEDQSLGTKFQQSYIPDLTKAIAINEKFTFIRELFRNSGVDFSNAVQKLNDCENIDAAFNLMEELKHQYLWDTTSSTYLSLCDLVRRRFL